MSAAEIRKTIPTRYGTALLAALIVSFLYAVLVMQALFTWLQIVIWSAFLAVSGYVVYLLYRLVVAVERIADEI